MYQIAMRTLTLFCLGSCLGASANADLGIYYDDATYIEAAGTVHLINFLDLPDGTPSFHGAEITPAFNYGLSGATFSDPHGALSLVEREAGDFALTAHSVPPEFTWIDVDLSSSARGVAILFEGETTLSIFDELGGLIAVAASEHLPALPRHDGHDHPGFMGIVSNIPIASVRIDRGESSEAILSFIFTPVPEPGTIVLLSMAILGLRRTPRSRRLSVRDNTTR